MKKLFKEVRFNILKLSALITTLALSVNVSFATNLTALHSDKLKPISDMVNTYAQYFAVFITFMALGAFVYNIIRMGAAGGNAARRENAIRGLMISGAVAMLVPFSSTIVFFLLKM